MSTKARWNNGIMQFYDPAVNHETVKPLAPLVFADDFLTPSLVVPAAGSLESGVAWAKKIVGAAPPTVAGVANGVNGLMSCDLTSASQKQNADLYFADHLAFCVTYGLVFECRLNVSTLPTDVAEGVWGVVSAWADGPDAITYSAFFTADGSGEIICESDDNATDSSATSGITVTAGDYHIYRIDMSNVAAIKWYIDGAEVASSTTFPWAASAANSKVQPIVSLYKASGAGVGGLIVDYVRLWQKRS